MNHLAEQVSQLLSILLKHTSQPHQHTEILLILAYNLLDFPLLLLREVSIGVDHWYLLTLPQRSKLLIVGGKLFVLNRKSCEGEDSFHVDDMTIQ